MRPIRPEDENFNFDKQFRDNLRNMEVTPPAGLWDKLEGDLDQQRELVKYNHWYYAAIVLLVFFSGFNLISAFDVEEYYAANELAKQNKFDGTYLLAGEHPSQVAGFSYSHYRRINKPLDYAFVDSEPLVTVTNYRENRYFTPYIGTNTSKVMYGKDGQKQNIAANDRFANANSLAGGLELQTPKNAYLTVSPQQHLLDNPAKDKATPAAPEMLADGDIVKFRKPVNALGHIKGFYVGGEYVFTNTRMFQKNSAFYPLLGKDAQYTFQRGYQYGVKVGYHFNHRMALELGWIINSAQGQHYSDNLYGKIPVSGSINLTYTQVPLLFKYKFARISGITKQPVSLNLIGGVAYGRLKTSSMSINDDRLEDISEMVSQNELGVIMGVEYDIYAHKNLFVTFGARTGLFADTKVFTGLEKDAPRLRNFSVGVSAAIHYQLPKRKVGGKVEY